MKKFTLLELLIVVAIIGILLSLLLPSLGNAREKAKSVVCKSNMKQISAAVEQYKVNTDGRLPKAVGAIATNWTGMAHYQEWRTLINNYMQVEDTFAGVFSCPSYDESLDSAGGYGWNASYLAIEPIDNNITDRQIYQGFKFLSISDPEETLLVGDTVDENTWDKNVCRAPAGQLSRIGNRHSGSLNVLWADSHVTTENPITMLNGKSGKQNYYYLDDKVNSN